MKQSELLRKQADMIDLAEKHGIDDWRCLVMINRGTNSGYLPFDLYTNKENLSVTHQYKYALGVVEGRPVFVGDELYTKHLGIKFKATSVRNEHSGERRGVPCFFDGDGCAEYIDYATWNPPKPKTILVELPVNMATYYAELQNQDISVMREACRKALEAIK